MATVVLNKKSKKVVAWLGLFLVIGSASAQPIFKLEGTVFAQHDSSVIENLPIELIDLETRDTLTTLTDNDGYYYFETGVKGERLVLQDKEYNVAFSDRNFKRHDGCKFMGSSSTESTKGIDESTLFIKDFYLRSFNCPDHVDRIPKLYFVGCDSLEQRENYHPRDSLSYLIKSLQDNPKVVLEISAHASDLGGDEAAQECASKRAELVRNYLIEQAIAEDRLVPKIYGPSYPVVPRKDMHGMSDIDRMRAAHKNNIVEFKVLSFDYTPK